MSCFFCEIMHSTRQIFSAEMTNNDKQLSPKIRLEKINQMKILTLTENLTNFLDGDLADFKLCLRYHVLNPSKIQDFLSLQGIKNDAKYNIGSCIRIFTPPISQDFFLRI
jgi:hypothetical protein